MRIFCSPNTERDFCDQISVFRFWKSHLISSFCLSPLCLCCHVGKINKFIVIFFLKNDSLYGLRFIHKWRLEFLYTSLLCFWGAIRCHHIAFYLYEIWIYYLFVFIPSILFDMMEKGERSTWKESICNWNDGW